MTNRPHANGRLIWGIALIVLLIAATTPTVSAEVVIDEMFNDFVDTSGNVSFQAGTIAHTKSFDGFILNHIENHPNLHYVGVTTTGNLNYPAEGKHDITYTIQDGKSGTGVMYVDYNRNLVGNVVSARFTIFLYEWDVGQLTGRKRITLSLPFASNLGANGSHKVSTSIVGDICGKDLSTNELRTYIQHTFTVVSSIQFQNRLIVERDTQLYTVKLIRNFDASYVSAISLMKGSNTIHRDYSSRDVELYALIGEIDGVKIEKPNGDEVLRSLSGDPGDPGETILRKGSVTMTDNNGTTITGFEVTAENAYTGQSYTVATDTDVAVMTLPMDRTIEIRNPQTGVYDEVPIGYYRFYGQSPGYKMLYEGGIQVSVVPEEYSQYELCDIRVTSESGPLTGKHKFQIRSRSDNSILQTGTISAKSATTGEWYNTTVSGGIATLTLPYDTSNPISQYAGNYAVYATSPGFEENDYGTQIVVMPQTVSEIYNVLLTPIGGIPPAGNVTLRIQAFSETGPGVVNAEIFIAGVSGEGASVWDTYTASSTGYLAVSVPGNSTYDIVASGAGYYDSARRVEVLSEDPPLIEIKLYLSGAPTLEPTTQPTGWPTAPPTTQPTGGIPDEDDDSEGFLMEAVRGIGLAFGVGFSTAKLIFGMLLALSIGYATAKQLRGGAAEFGLGLLGGTLLGVLIGLLPVWIIVVLLLVVGLYIGNRYVGGGANNG